MNKNYIDGNCRVKTSKLYRTYRAILQRCNNPKDRGYINYGGRGIKCLWKNYLEFKNDMEGSIKEHLKTHTSRNTTIDRIDVNGHYCKENCRWSTQEEQSRNTRKTLKIEYQGKNLNIYQLSSITKFNLSPDSVRQKIKKGLSAKEIINTPSNYRGRLCFEKFNLVNISERDKKIIFLIKKGYNMAEIGRQLGLTRERIRKIVNKNIKK